MSKICGEKVRNLSTRASTSSEKWAPEGDDCHRIGRHDIATPSRFPPRSALSCPSCPHPDASRWVRVLLRGRMGRGGFSRRRRDVVTSEREDPGYGFATARRICDARMQNHRRASLPGTSTWPRQLPPMSMFRRVGARGLQGELPDLRLGSGDWQLLPLTALA